MKPVEAPHERISRILPDEDLLIMIAQRAQTTSCVFVLMFLLMMAILKIPKEIA
jgi:hypothetical protein